MNPFHTNPLPERDPLKYYALTEPPIRPGSAGPASTNKPTPLPIERIRAELERRMALVIPPLWSN